MRVLLKALAMAAVFIAFIAANWLMAYLAVLAEERKRRAEEKLLERAWMGGTATARPDGDGGGEAGAGEEEE